MSIFKLKTKFKPTGDQPRAIEKLTAGIKAGKKHQVLLGVTGSGKTFTMANVVAQIQKPTLVISHNKTLAAQLYQEFREFFPNNAIHYFVSYYDYYQPEAYIPHTDTYIEKDAKINEELDRLRHATTQDLLTRKDVLVVASVSCIYNIGSPQDYQNLSLDLSVGQKINRQDLLRSLRGLQYARNDFDFGPGTYRARGNIVEINLPTGQKIIRVEMTGDKIISIDPINNASAKIFPAKFWVSPQNKINIAIQNIKTDLNQRLTQLKSQNKLLEAQRLKMRTNYDIEMIKQNGYCTGIENYSRYFEGRPPGTPPHTLLDYFPRDYLLFIDESHMSLPQIRGMHAGDFARKTTLVNFGFRLPSAIDNRPLNFNEFKKRQGQTIYVSATPQDYEIKMSLRGTTSGSDVAITNYEVTHTLRLPRRLRSASPPRNDNKTLQSDGVVEQLIRPTGLLDPKIFIRPTKNQVSDLIKEIKQRVAERQRVLVTTITKRLSEDLTDFLQDAGIKAQYLHSEIKTLERPEILRDLRTGKYDVLVGINLLREGLDLPEVSLVAILDADKEGFLRNATTLIQTMGRASRRLNGAVIMYADRITRSMEQAISETNRRRKIQENYNRKNHITPRSIKKEIRDNILPVGTRPATSLSESMPIEALKHQMKKAAKNLDFETAAEIRDLIKKIRQ